MNRNRFKKGFATLRFPTPEEKNARMQQADPENFPSVACYQMRNYIKGERADDADPKDKYLFELESEFIEYLQWHSFDNYRQLSDIDHEMLHCFFLDACDYQIPYKPHIFKTDFLRSQEQRMRFLLENEPKPRKLFPLSYYDFYPLADLIKDKDEGVEK